ncbi:MAG TPA: DUF72 domain-containing protein [Gammaproteobacteria bacterium]|nr:DUF72 domain-containing protein [Gammaproteobacteria bacterium]
METRIGISGWRYAPWRGVFYPKKLAQRLELHYASRQVNSIEINGSFYSLQRPESFQKWHDDVPDDFVFSVKGNRYITHIRRLQETGPLLANFFASGVLHLRRKLGPILWQLPPSFPYDHDRIEDFFQRLPRTFFQAAKLAKTADFIKADLPDPLPRRRLRHALEVRHHSFETPEFVEQARRHDVANVFADTAGKWPYFEDVTSDFVYARLHGEIELYKSGYDDGSLRWWAKRILAWQAGSQAHDAVTVSADKPKRMKRDAYVYFDNDVKVRAPFDAARLHEMLVSKAMLDAGAAVRKRPPVVRQSGGAASKNSRAAGR